MLSAANETPGDILSSGCARVLLLSPITPALSGNGLAMRACALQATLSKLATVHTETLPLAETDASTGQLAIPTEEAAARSWLHYPRSRQVACHALPERARLASPALGEQLLSTLEGQSFDLIYVFRLYCAGAVISLLEAWPKVVAVLDVDEGDALVYQQISTLPCAVGQSEFYRAEAEAYAAFSRNVIPWFYRVIASTELECARLKSTFPDLQPCWVANIAPTVTNRSPCARNAAPAVLFVGNLDYLPNRDAVERLMETTFPVLKKLLPEVQVHIVGRGGEALQQRWGTTAGVNWHGYLEDLTPLYTASSLALVPLRVGGGSRIKILEAMAHGLPVVATTKAAEGLNVKHGAQLLLAETDIELAAAVHSLTKNPDLGERLAIAAYGFIEQYHSEQSMYDQLINL